MRKKEQKVSQHDDSDEQGATRASPDSVEARLARNGGLSYLHIPALDIQQSSTFYERVFGWRVHRRDNGRASFDDASGYVSGAWVTEQAIAREPGLLLYIYVDRIDNTLQQVIAEGGEVVRAPYPEGNLWVATFRDPAGNMLGVWQEGPR